MTNTNRTIDRIRKLLALAKDGANENEADNARRMADALMEAAGITDADLDEAGEVDPISTVGATSVPRKSRSWEGVLALAVARVLGCFVASTPQLKRRVWYGTQAQREAAVALHAWLVEQVDDLAVRYIRRLTRAERSSASHAYRLGLASAVAAQARELVAAKPAPAGEAGLVRRDQLHAAIGQTIPPSLRDCWNNGGTGRSPALPRGLGHMERGTVDGAAIQLRRSVGSGQAKRLGSGS